jgi:AraC-like DNA-binding protein
MKFEKIIPSPGLQPYIRYFALSENTSEGAYKVFPSTGLVMGFQYRGQLSVVYNNTASKLATNGITGLADRFKVFKNSGNTGTILVYFTEVGLSHFTAVPAHELFNQSISLDNIFDNARVNEVEEKLAAAITDNQRIQLVERFLFSQLKVIQSDRLILEAITLIYQSKGTIPIKALNERLFISQSPFEKRFRKLVGTTPKKFASIVRFNFVLNELNKAKSLTELCYENNFFDQAHFIKYFKQFTGDTPEHFKRFL